MVGLPVEGLAVTVTGGAGFVTVRVPSIICGVVVGRLGAGYVPSMGAGGTGIGLLPCAKTQVDSTAAAHISVENAKTVCMIHL